MALVEQARPTLFFAKPRQNALVRRDAVAVRLAGVGGLRQRVADPRVDLRVAAVAELGLQTVVVGDAEVGQHVDLTHAAVHRQNRTREVGRGYRPHLADGGAIEHRRRIEIDRPGEVGPVLVDIVGTEEQPLPDLPLGADRRRLAARVHQLVGVVRQQVEVQSVLGKLRLVEVALPRLDRDVARRKLRRRQRLRVERHRQARPRQAGRETGLPGRRGVGREAVQAVYQVAGEHIRDELGVVHAVAAANRGARVTPGVPAEADARREVGFRVGQRLLVVAEPGVEREVVVHADAVLHEHGGEPLRQLVAADAEVDRLLVVLDVGQLQLIERRRGRRQEREGAERRGARLAAGAARGVPRHAGAEPERLFAERPRQRVGELKLAAVEVRLARLADRERHRAGAGVGGRERLRLPERDRIAVEITDARLVEEVRAQHPCVAGVPGHRAARVPARHAGSAGAADRVVRVRVVEVIDVQTEHQRLLRRDLVIDPPVEQRLAVVPDVGRAAVRRHHERRQAR